MKNICIIGVGLIGGSFALNLKAIFNDVVILGIDSSKSHISEALDLGIIDKEGSYESIIKSDLVVIATPVNVTLELLPTILNRISSKALVIDMGSTKADICTLVDMHPKRPQFLANHPIAGTEFSGPGAAYISLFKNKINIICDIEKTNPELCNPLLKTFKNMGMNIRYMDSKAHDKHIAYVSHLSHISSFMLGKTVIEKEKNERNIFDMAGSGFESTVRLAKSSPEMWAPIFEQNKTNVIETLEEYIHNLNHFKSLMEANDFEAIRNEMKNTNYIKTILKGIS